MPPEPLPVLRDRLNLGIIIDCPFLHQVVLPTSLQTTVDSTMMPSTATGLTTYSFAGPLIQSAVFVGGPVTRTTTFHYTKLDPQEKLDILQGQLDKTKQEMNLTDDKLERKALKQAVAQKKSEIKLAKKDAKKGPPPMQLAYSSFVEEAPGLVGVSGETKYTYEGLDIVSSVTSSTTDEVPPRVSELEKKYSYNMLGQLESCDVMGCITNYTYEPMGRLLLSDGGFVSPTGDFATNDDSTYTYTPPNSDPIPGNALIGSLTKASSGPRADSGAPKPGADLLKQMMPQKTESTTVVGLYIYA